MLHIERLPDSELDAFVDIVANAFVGMQLRTRQDKENFKERIRKMSAEEPTINLYGAWRDTKLVGGMRLFDWTMTLLSAKAAAGGVGLVAVDLMHKKQHVAKEMIEYFLRHYREREAPMAMLYAFRPDFYKKMGFGYGTKLNQYRLRPGYLRRSDGKEHVTFLGAEDAELMQACYTRFADRTNGMFERSARTFTRLFTNEEVRVAGYKRDGEVRGYLSFTFKPVQPDNFLLNNLQVHELVYEDSAALNGLLAFLHGQADQVHEIVLNTQDESFHFVPADPRNGSNNIFNLAHETNIQAMGIMYRVVDTPAIFRSLRDHDFGGQTLKLKLSLEDSFFPINHGSTLIHFEEGAARVQGGGGHDAEIRLDISDFSSLLMGAVSFKSLYQYGLVDISDPRFVESVHRLFLADQKPVCMTHF